MSKEINFLAEAIHVDSAYGLSAERKPLVNVECSIPDSMVHAILSNFTIEEFVNHFGKEDILDNIGSD